MEIENIDYRKLKILAESILKSNLYGVGKDSGYTAASGKIKIPNIDEEKWLYPFQWLWDTFFICAWNTDIQQSFTDAIKFLNSQHENGFLGHIRYNRDILKGTDYFPMPTVYYKNGLPENEITSKITQPPNIGYGILELAKRTELNEKKRIILKEMFEKTIKFHKYIYENRIKNGCMVTIHPWENGDDNSPKWDVIYKTIKNKIGSEKVLEETIKTWLEKINVRFERIDIKLIKPAQRPTDDHYYLYLFLLYIYDEWDWNIETILNKSPFRVIDPLTNSILLRSNVSLLELMDILDIRDANLKKTIKEWINMTQKGLEKLWSEENNLYLTYDLENNNFIEIETISGLIPIFSTCIKKERALKIAKKIELIYREKQTKYIIPSTLFTETSYVDLVRYWRGPVWIITNELISDGLKFYGHLKTCDLIRKSSLQLVANNIDSNLGFYEYYNPITGKGLGSAKQSWTAAAILNILSDLESK